MNHSQVLVPGFPPPLLSISNEVQNNSNHVTFPSTPIDLNVYKERLKNYLSVRRNQDRSGPHQKNQSQKVVHLNDVSMEMSYCFDMIEIINTEIETLSKSTSSMPESQWIEQIAQLNAKTVDLSAICSKYKDTQLINEIQNSIQKRQTKRSRIKKRKAETKLFKRYEALNRERKHKEIDKWLEKNSEDILKIRRDIETKQRAAQVLMDVKSRKNEADKYMLVLNSLKELHRVRNRDKRSSDEHVSSKFNQQIDEMKQMWVDAYKNYEHEEKGLLTFLNCTNNLEEWQGSIFGKETKEDTIFPFMKKDKSLKHLIKIRNLWDQCLVHDHNPFGSSVPLGWAIPNSNPSDNWKAYIKKDED